MAFGFERERCYSVPEIAARFAIEWTQTGIMRAKNEPVVVLISDPKNRRFYNNRWRDDGIFEFFGQGRNGSMTWTPNNCAVRDHFENGCDLLLFETEGRKKRFVGEVILQNIKARVAKGEDRKPRTAIIFELALLPDGDASSTNDIEIGDPTTSDATTNLDELRRKAYAASSPNGAGRDGKPRTVYERSRDVHRYVIGRAKGYCESKECRQPGPFIGKNGKPYLEAHHTIRRCDEGPDVPTHVIALCPTCHRRVHFGADGGEYNARLINNLKEIELRYEAPEWG